MNLSIIIPRCMRSNLVIAVDDRHDVYLCAADVERIAGLPAWDSGATEVPGMWFHDDVAFYSLETATTLAMQASGSEAARQFCGWLDVELPAYLEPDVLAAARRSVSPLVSLTIDNAARALADDPGVRMTRADLFAHLERHGWVSRAAALADEWAPTAFALDQQYLTTRREPHPDPSRPKHSIYERVYVTPTGLDRLRATLTAEVPALTPPLSSSLFA